MIHSLESLTRLLRTKEPFRLVKFNDGEWHAMVGKKGTNCDNHKYSAQLRKELLEAYKYLCTNSIISDYVLNHCTYPSHAELASKIGFPNSHFPQDLLLHKPDNLGIPLHNFYKAIRDDHRPKIFVGPARVDPSKFLKVAHHVEVPLLNAYNKLGIPTTLCHDFATDYPTPIFLLSCGFSSCLLAQDIIQTNPHATVIDLGSALDPILFGCTRKDQSSKGILHDFYRDFGCPWPPMSHYYDELEGWFNFQDVYQEAVDNAPYNQQSLFVEVGSWLGKSAAYMGVAVTNSNKPILFDCVDHFKGSTSEQKKAHKSAKTRNIKGECANILRPFWCTYANKDYSTRTSSGPSSPPNTLCIKVMTSEQAASTYQDNSIDFCFIDAGHTQKEVEQDIKHWLPKIKQGGTLAGHDYNTSSFPGVRAAVDRLLPQRELVSHNCWKVSK